MYVTAEDFIAEHEKKLDMLKQMRDKLKVIIDNLGDEALPETRLKYEEFVTKVDRYYLGIVDFKRKYDIQ